MDYADGGDLSDKIKSTKESHEFITENEVLNYFTQMCLAIKHIHDRKIIHRDLKAQNIFLEKNGTIKLGDFGIAKVLEQTVAQANTQVGTPYYISPEIIKGKKYSFETDIWSLGVILYEMCALDVPIKAKNLHELYMKISS
jgi:NIMA (never in mitosis gene a)-related kinase